MLCLYHLLFFPPLTTGQLKLTVTSGSGWLYVQSKHHCGQILYFVLLKFNSLFDQNKTNMWLCLLLQVTFFHTFIISVGESYFLK